MNMIYMLIGISILLALIFLVAFFWASKSGQHDDTYTPAIRMLFDDEVKPDVEKYDKDHI
jgi:cbb3-type cytochrome oxidase maturation protein